MKIVQVSTPKTQNSVTHSPFIVISPIYISYSYSYPFVPLCTHRTLQFASIRFNSLQFASIHFNSLQFASIHFRKIMDQHHHQQQHNYTSRLPENVVFNLDKMKHTLKNIQNIQNISLNSAAPIIKDLITICTVSLAELQGLHAVKEKHTEDTNRAHQELISLTANARGKFNYTLLDSMDPEIQFRTDLDRYTNAIEEAANETSYDKISRENRRPECIRFNQNSIHLTHNCGDNCTFSPLDRFCKNNCKQCTYCLHALEQKSQHKDN